MDRDHITAPERADADAAARPPCAPAPALPWSEVARAAPYFVTDAGAPWTPIGQNDSISWLELKGLFARRDLPGVDRHLRFLADHGVTCLRLMLEYAQVRHRYFERPMGVFPKGMVRLWDDLFALCERHGLRVLLTPFDTYWTWVHWKHHPYNRAHGGCLDGFHRVLLCPDARRAIKARLSFAVERWSGSGALFAWDLWNEIHPAQAEGRADVFDEFIHDLSTHVRGLEERLHGRAHPQTVSLFGPELWWQPHLPVRDPIFRHPDLDFATLHLYHEGTIDDPRNTVDAALATGRIVRESIAEIVDGRPFLDTEHGPIHTFKDKKKKLPEPFDDEYFRHMQWAHLASGGAGGGMRWPNRKPHVLTRGMRRAQRSLADFVPLIDWARFTRVNLNEELEVSARGVAAFACADARQAVVWLLRTAARAPGGMLRPDATPIRPRIRVPRLGAGRYRVTAWDTAAGRALAAFDADAASQGGLALTLPRFSTDLALAISRL
jgi:hypothetical protein